MPAIERIYDTTSDPRVYGNRIVTYSIDGSAGDDFADVIAYASIKQSRAIEAATSGLADTVKVRQKKVAELSDALATLTEAVASMDADSKDTSRKSSVSKAKMLAANETFSKYGVTTMELDSDGQITYAEATRRQNDVQLVLDTENNDLSQAVSMLQSFISRRDNAFKVASKIVRKDDSTASSTINAIGA